MTDDGVVKVLDFGLAKALAPDHSGVDPAASPTISLTAAATQMGMIIGTAAYMAPEQAKGRPVDKRADIWVFGAVLYEMLAGRRPFAGDDVSDTLAAVLRDPVDWSVLPDGTPSGVPRLLERCPERDRAERLRDIGEARITLGGLSIDPAETLPPDESATQSPSRLRPRDLLLGALAGGAVVAAIASVLPWGGRGTPVPAGATEDATSRFVVQQSGLTFRNVGLAVSPDGSQIVLAGRRPDRSTSFFLRRLSSLEVEPIRGTEGGSRRFFWPDGREIGFQSGAGICMTSGWTARRCRRRCSRLTVCRPRCRGLPTADRSFLTTPTVDRPVG